MAQQTRVVADALAGQLGALGVQPGGVLVVHTAFSRVKPVAAGPRGLIDALRSALGRVLGMFSCLEVRVLYPT